MSQEDLKGIVRRALSARTVELEERIQSLWSGYGEIRRISCTGLPFDRAIVKYVHPPQLTSNPKSAESRSHARKLRSYEVERAFYDRFAPHCAEGCRVPRSYYGAKLDRGWLFILEDLDAAGFPLRAHDPSTPELELSLKWLAHFHARFLGVAPDPLWRRGTYWHLATRPDELAVTKNSLLRSLAPELDRKLGTARYRTLVHGDAKSANFCFSEQRQRVAAVDFQYVGGGVGVQDVAYLLHGELSSSDFESSLTQHLDTYFQELRSALSEPPLTSASGQVIPLPAPLPLEELDLLEEEWRALFPIAWLDFHRFLAGWAPGAERSDAYGRRLLDALS